MDPRSRPKSPRSSSTAPSSMPMAIWERSSRTASAVTASSCDLKRGSSRTCDGLGSESPSSDVMRQILSVARGWGGPRSTPSSLPSESAESERTRAGVSSVLGIVRTCWWGLARCCSCTCITSCSGSSCTSACPSPSRGRSCCSFLLPHCRSSTPILGSASSATALCVCACGNTPFREVVGNQHYGTCGKRRHTCSCSASGLGSMPSPMAMSTSECFNCTTWLTWCLKACNQQCE